MASDCKKDTIKNGCNVIIRRWRYIYIITGGVGETKRKKRKKEKKKVMMMMGKKRIEDDRYECQMMR